MRLKALFTLAFGIVCSAAFSQSNSNDTTVHKKSSFLYRAEIGYSETLRYGDHNSSTPFHNIRFGGNVEIPLNTYFGVETGLNYNYGFGEKSQYYAVPTDTAKYSYTSHSLNVPARITFNLPIFWGLKLFAYAGPSFNIGLSEPTKLTTNTTYHLTGSDYDAYKEKVNRFNIRLGTGGGVQWKSLRIKSGYDWGILNIGKVKGLSEYDRGWSVSLEYEF
ncbi:MAG: porin family protein [Paludibacteraceae bacterium]